MNLKNEIIEAQGREKVKLIREFKALSPREKVKVLKEYAKLTSTDPKVSKALENIINVLKKDDLTDIGLKSIEKDVEYVDANLDKVDEVVISEAEMLFKNKIAEHAGVSLDSIPSLFEL